MKPLSLYRVYSAIMAQQLFVYYYYSRLQIAWQSMESLAFRKQMKIDYSLGLN
jgi:hypothetical protein